MNKVIAKNGARHDAEKLFADLQEYVRLGIKNAMSGVVSRYGIVALTTESGQIVETNNSLLVSYTPPPYGPSSTDHGSVNVAPGFAITEELAFLNVVNGWSGKVPIVDGVHTLYISPVIQYSQYTTVVNGFLNPPIGTNTTPTRQIDSYEFLWDNPNPDPNVHSLMLAKIDITNVGHEVEDHRSDNVMAINTHVLAQNFSGTDITTGTVAKDYGGTGTNLSSSGGGNPGGGKNVLVQGADHSISSRALISADLPALPAGTLTGTIAVARIPSLPGSIISSALPVTMLPYKEYVANFLFDGTAADPDITIISNTLGTVTCEKALATGLWSIASSGLFTIDKTVFFVTNSSTVYSSIILLQYQNSSLINMRFCNNGSAVNTISANIPIMIRVYP